MQASLSYLQKFSSSGIVLQRISPINFVHHQISPTSSNSMPIFFSTSTSSANVVSKRCKISSTTLWTRSDGGILDDKFNKSMRNFGVRFFASNSDGNGRNSNAKYFAGSSKLQEIGRLETPKVGEPYEAGQSFLHRVFSFRGVILFPFTITVYDIEVPSINNARTGTDTSPPLVEFTPVEEKEKEKPAQNEAPSSAPPTSTTTTSMQTYYQVLVDHRDATALKNIYQDEIVTRKDDPFVMLFQALKGFAYVAHEDILPYSPTEMVSIEHEHFSRFLVYTQGKGTNFVEKPALISWRAKFQEALRLSEVRRETQENIRITVLPFFLGYALSTGSAKKRTFCWVYTLRLENLARDSITIKDEEWTILDSDMKKPTIAEKPLTKSQPLRLTPGTPAFHCQSRIQLPTRNGFIWGRLTLEREDGSVFQCKIPTLSLQSPKNGGLGGPVITTAEPMDR